MTYIQLLWTPLGTAAVEPSTDDNRVFLCWRKSRLINFTHVQTILLRCFVPDRARCRHVNPVGLRPTRCRPKVARALPEAQYASKEVTEQQQAASKHGVFRCPACVHVVSQLVISVQYPSNTLYFVVHVLCCYISRCDWMSRWGMISAATEKSNRQYLLVRPCLGLQMLGISLMLSVVTNVQLPARAARPSADGAGCGCPCLCRNNWCSGRIV